MNRRNLLTGAIVLPLVGLLPEIEAELPPLIERRIWSIDVGHLPAERAFALIESLKEAFIH